MVPSVSDEPLPSKLTESGAVPACTVAAATARGSAFVPVTSTVQVYDAAPPRPSSIVTVSMCIPTSESDGAYVHADSLQDVLWSPGVCGGSILSGSPADRAFAECLRLVAPGDHILLLGDGVYAALADSPARKNLEASGARIHVLQADAAAAGILGQLGGVETVDIAGFVALSERCPRQLAWF